MVSDEDNLAAVCKTYGAVVTGICMYVCVWGGATSLMQLIAES